MTDQTDTSAGAVDRYEVSRNRNGLGYSNGLQRAEEGGFVSYSDYAALLAAKEKAEDRVTALSNTLSERQDTAHDMIARAEAAEAEAAALRGRLEGEVLNAALAEFTLRHSMETVEERIGRQSAMRGIMVRLSLYNQFEEALDQPKEGDGRICRICDGGPGNDGPCLCGHEAWEGEDNDG